MDNAIEIDTEYDPSHKTTSVASNCSNTSSIWDPLPSLYSGRAGSVASELDEPLEGNNRKKRYGIINHKHC